MVERGDAGGTSPSTPAPTRSASCCRYPSRDGQCSAGESIRGRVSGQRARKSGRNWWNSGSSRASGAVGRGIVASISTKPKFSAAKLLMRRSGPWTGPNFPKLRQSGGVGTIARAGIQLESRPRVQWRVFAGAQMARGSGPPSGHLILIDQIPRLRENLLLRFSEGFPSGQRGQTVNLLAQPSEVRILPPPPVDWWMR